MKTQAAAGHLRHGSLHLKQTEEAKKKMGKGQQRVWSLRKMNAPQLNWKRKEAE